MWRLFLRPLLFQFDPEWAHHFSMKLFSWSTSPSIGRSMVQSLFSLENDRLKTECVGLKFPNPVGLAAGFDKDARWIDSLATLGFSHLEVGTLTAQAQPGNPPKRLFRFPKDKALLNCMGFNNRGSEAARESLEKSSSIRLKNRSVLGINIGLTKKVADAIRDSESIDPAIEDYQTSFRRIARFADYITLNVSSPNTPGLRNLQHPQKLGELLQAIETVNSELIRDGITESKKPVFVKLAPDLSDGELTETLEAITAQDIAGIIATNTTISDANISTDSELVKSKRCQCPQPGGGFSGKPLTEVSRNFVAQIFKKTDGRLPIIGVGGIMNGEDAWKMICAGASLVQVYTGFVYGGPFFVKQINRHLLKTLESNQLTNIADAVGRDID